MRLNKSILIQGMVILSLLFVVNAMEEAAVLSSQATTDEINRIKACLEIGRMLFVEGEQQDFVQARTYLERAAEQKVHVETAAWAYILLAELYIFGWGVSKDPEKGAAYAHKAEELAKENDELRPIRDRVFFLCGEDSVMDSAFDHSAILGKEAQVLPVDEAVVHAEFSLGEMLVTGSGCEKNKGEARKYFKRVVGYELVNEESAWSYLWLAHLHRSKKEMKQAHVYLTKAEKMSKKNKKLRLLGNVVSVLEKRGMKKISYKDCEDVLCDAVEYKDMRVVVFLSELGVDVTGRELLYRAVFNRNKEMAEFLLDRGADIESSKEYGSRALHLASSNGHKEMVELLLDRGAELEAKEKDGDRALHAIAISGYRDVVELLLARGADKHAKNRAGKRPVDLAKGKDIEELLN